MSTSSTFEGIGFSIESVTQLNASTIRIVYTDDPIQVSQTGAHDGLNPQNYVLAGPGANAVQSVSGVNGIPQALDLYTGQQLLPGLWTLTVANVQTISGVSLQSPTSIQLEIVVILPPPPLGQGARSPSSFDSLRRFFNPGLKGKNWTALLTGIAAGDDYVRDTAVAAQLQLYRSTASAPYLDDLCADNGTQRPPSMGLGDDLYRKLSIISTSYQSVESTLEGILEIFYGSTATRASATSSLPAVWNLRDGDQLFVRVDERQTVTINFSRQDFSQIGMASAVEVAMALTRGFQMQNNRAYALPVTNPLTGFSYVQIFSPTLGHGGAIRILGGRAQNVLGFPSAIATTQAPGTQWTVTIPTATNGITPGTARFTWTAGTDPGLAQVQEGDYANVYGPGFSAANTGALTIVHVTATSFDVTLLGAVAEVVTTTLASDLTFWSPDKLDINATARPAYATTTDRLNIVLPTTTEAVVRGPNTGSYVHGQTAIGIASGSRDATGLMTITTTAPTGLASGSWVQLDGLQASAATAVAPHWSAANTGTPSIRMGTASTKLPDGRILVTGGWDTTSVGDTTDAWAFNPTTNTWASVGPMLFTHAFHNAIYVPTIKKVIVFGGTGSNKNTELFDPVTNVWTPSGVMSQVRQGAGGVYVPYTNKVLAIGANPQVSHPIDIESWDPSSGTWTTVANVISHDITQAAVVTLYDGRIMIFGGVDYATSAVTTTCDIYNPATNSWVKNVANLTTARTGAAAFLVPIGPAGRVYIIGGSDNSGTAFSSVEILDPATMTFTAGPSMPTATATPFMGDFLADGRIIIPGTDDNAGTVSPTVCILNPWTNTWTTVASMAKPHTLGIGATMNDGRFLVTGTTEATGAGTGGQWPPEVFTPYQGVASSGHLDGRYQVVGTASTTIFSIQQGTKAAVTLIAGAGTATSVVPVTNGTQGPYIYEDKAGVAITGIQTVTTSTLVAGQNYRVINVTSTKGFAASGFICFAFAGNNQLTPVKYLAVLSATQILMDPTFVFPTTLPAGTTVTDLKQNFPWIPDDASEAASFYATTTAAGREAAEAAAKALVAGGIDYAITIEYPSDRGLGNEGAADEGAMKLSDIVRVYGGDDLNSEIAGLQED